MEHIDRSRGFFSAHARPRIAGALIAVALISVAVPAAAFPRDAQQPPAGSKTPVVEQSRPSSGADQPIPAPTKVDEEVLAAELALLDRAARVEVMIPPDARTLREVVDALAAQSSIAIDVNWDALVPLGVSADGSPPVTRGRGSLLAVLDSVCLGLGVAYGRPRAEAMLDRIVIMPPTVVGEIRRTRAYHTDALTEEFMVQSSEHLDSEGWLRNGGERQHATRIDGTVLVSAPASMHRRLAALLEELRSTRPAAVELSALFVRLPSASWREMAMDSSQPASPESISAKRGAQALMSPTIVAVIGHEASTEFVNGDIQVSIAFRPELEAEAALLVHFDLKVTVGGTTIVNQGTLPAPVAGLPAIVSMDLPDGTQTLVACLRARPLPRAGW